MNTPPNKQQQALVKQIITLVVLVVLIALVAIFSSGGSKKEATVQNQPPIDTGFDTEAIKGAQKQNNSYPEVNADNLGKNDPFAP